jgi:hypothetical protein
MGEVFIGTELLGPDNARTVVVKRLLPGVNQLCRDLFEREGQVLELLDSPNIIALYGRGPGYLLLEYVKGTDVGSLISHFGRRGQVLPLDAALALSDGILCGLRDLHAAQNKKGTRIGLVHRDINPSNILIGNDGLVKIADFGVAHLAVTDQPTQVGVKGTLSYMAPEQMSSRPVDARTDIFAAGLVLYEVFTGVPARPAGQVGIAELLAARRQLPTAPSQIRNGVPPGLDEVLMTALNPDPDLRYPDAETMLSALLDSMAKDPGVSPSRATLADAIQGVTRAAMPPSHTLGTTLGIDLSVPLDEPPPPQASFRSMMWSVVLLLLVAGLLIVPRFLDEPSTRIRDFSTGPDVVIRDQRGPQIDIGAIGVAGDPGTKPVDGPTGARTDIRKSDAQTPSKKDSKTVTAQADTKPKPRTRRQSLRISSLNASPLYVTGKTITPGLAPRITNPVSSGPHVFRIRGPGKMAVIVRARRSQLNGRWQIKLGAPRGIFYEASCGGKDLGSTPTNYNTFRTKIDCALRHNDGRSMTFQVRVLAL